MRQQTFATDFSEKDELLSPNDQLHKNMIIAYSFNSILKYCSTILLCLMSLCGNTQNQKFFYVDAPNDTVCVEYSKNLDLAKKNCNLFIALHGMHVPVDTIMASINFSQDVFWGKFQLQRIVFTQNCIMDSIYVISPSDIVNIDRSIFLAAFYINYSTFFNKVNFKRSKFFKAVVFNSTSFLNYFRIPQAEFHEDFTIQYSTFKDTISFLSAHFKNIFFKNVNVSKRINFSDVKIDGIADLRGILTNPNTIIPIDLTNSDIDKLRINYDGFLLSFFTIDGKSHSDDQIRTTYEQLLDNFSIHGQHNDYEKLDLEFLQWKASKGDFWDRIEYQASSFWWKFGYARNRIIKWTIGLFLFFVLVSIVKLDKILPVYQVADLENSWNEKKKSKRVLFWRLFFSLIWTAYLFFGVKIQLESLKHKNFSFTIFVLACYLSGLTCLAFLIKYILHF